MIGNSINWNFSNVGNQLVEGHMSTIQGLKKENLVQGCATEIKRKVFLKNKSKIKIDHKFTPQGLRNVKRRKRGPRPEQAYHWSPQLPFYMMTEQHNDFVDQEKPCVGLCYITKLEKKNQKLDRDSKKMADKMANTN